MYIVAQLTFFLQEIERGGGQRSLDWRFEQGTK